MTVTNWNTTVIDGKPFLVIDVAKFRIPLDWDPSSNMFIAVAAPDGGLGNFPALLKGDDGDTPDIDTTINFTPMDPDDPDPEFASWTETAPNVYKLNLGLKRGPKGDDGDTVLDVDDYGTPVAGRLLRVKSTLDGFEYVAPYVPLGRYLPASFANAPSGNAAYTIATIPVDAQPHDWWPEVEAQCVITGTGADFRGDLVARLSTAGVINGETAGPIVARGFGPIGTNATGISTIVSAAPPAGSNADYDKVLGGNTAVIYIRVERQAGANTFTTVGSQTVGKVRVAPIL